MRKRSRSLLICSALALAWGSLVYGAGGRPLPTPAPPRAKMADTGNPGAAGAPGPELRRLAMLAGRWTVRQSMWADPAKPPAIDRGMATFTPILGGRHLRQELAIESATKPFHGLGFLGFDDATRKYDSLWMDVNFDGVILAHGGYDPARRVYTFFGAVPDPKRSGAMSPLREVMHVVDVDHFTYEYYERHGETEMLAVRLEYTRMR